MALLSERDRLTVRARLASITQPVTLLFFTQTIGAPDSVVVARQILNDVAGLSDLIRVAEVNFVLEKDRVADYGIVGVPAIVLLRNDQDTRMRFLGAPTGHEFMSLLQAIILAGIGDSGLSPESRALIAGGVTEAIEIKVFGTPTCPQCPQAVALAHRMAVESPFITSTCVDAIEFPGLSREFRVNGVPKTVVSSANDAQLVELLGALPEDELVAAIVGLPPGRLSD